MYDTASPWRKSRRSYSSGGCVETAAAAGRILVRDSADRPGPVLAFTPGVWALSVRRIKNGAVPAAA